MLYSQSYDVVLCEPLIYCIDKYIPMLFRNHTNKRRNFLLLPFLILHLI